MKKLFGRRLTGKFIAVIIGFIFIFSIGFLTGINKTTVKSAGNKVSDTKSTEKTSTKDNSVANKTEDNSSKTSTEQPKENKIAPSTAPLDPNKKLLI
nr:hypothetical protein [Clostridium botulinum]